MKLLINNFVKKIIIITYVIIMLTFFCLTPAVNAATQTKMEEGEFYYAGTTEGAYVVTEGVFSWLLSKIGDIVDFLLGLFTMGGRMVFVGWAALLEEILTASLEATTGVPMITDVNSTEMDGMIKSSNNVTLEAIVYNKVPVLNINLFSEEDYNKCISGTGQYWVECETCSEEHGLDDLCRMEDCSCTECQQFIANSGLNGENVISTIRDYVRMWYYVMRLIAMAAMLLVLMFLGIKGATTTIAQDKAVYKRMLYDWVVGMIILFSIQYIMIMMINLNESLVDIIKDVQTGITEITMKEFNIEKKSNQDIEISIYEAVRTRAYDAKLMNGTLGMVLYISLVFMAIKYTFIYAKRYFAIIVLTLMAPGVAFSYAIQKVLSGKSAAFSKWLQEYFVNVIIQTIHALVYTVFITTVLVISLKSISGMILALFIMNFMSKAEPIFRKIFKMNGSIADDAEKNSDPRSLINKAKTAVGFMTANKLLKNSPVSKAVKIPMKAAGVGAVLTASNIDNKFFKKGREERAEKRAGKNNETLIGVYNELKEYRETLGGNAVSAFNQVSTEYEDNKENSIYLDLEAQEAMEKELADLEKNAYEDVLNGGGQEAEERYQKIQATREKFDEATTLTASQVFGAHISKFLNKDNYYTKPTGKDIQNEMKNLGDLGLKPKDGESAEKFEERKEAELRKKATSNLESNRKQRESILPKYYYDKIQNKFVKKSMGKLIANQMKSENLLGLSDADKKMLKEITAFGKNAFIGMGSVFVGLGTLTQSPGAGIGLLAKGLDSKIKFDEAMGRGEKTISRPMVSNKNKKYSFNRFNKGAKQTLVNAAIEYADGERNKAVVANVQKNHTQLYNTLRLGGMGLTVAGALTVAPILAPKLAFGVLGATSAVYMTGKMGARYQGFTQKGLLGRLSKQHFKQFETRKKELIQDQIRDASLETIVEFNANYAAAIELLDEAIELYEKEQERRQKEAEELEKRKLEAALEHKEYIKVSDGSIIKLDKIDDKSRDQIIEEAIVETILKTALLKEIVLEKFGNKDDLFGNKDDLADIEKVIKQKLEVQGFSMNDLGITDNDLKKEIIKKIDSVVTTELGLESNTEGDRDPLSEEGVDHVTSPVGSGEMFTDKDTNSKSNSELDFGPKALKMIEKTLVKQAIRDVISDPTNKITKAEQITQEMVENAVKNRISKIVATQEEKKVNREREERKTQIEAVKADMERKKAEEMFSGEEGGLSSSTINKDGSKSAQNAYDSEVKSKNKSVTLLDLLNKKSTDGSLKVDIYGDGSVKADSAVDGSRSVGEKNNPLSGNSQTLGIEAELTKTIQDTINEIRNINAPTGQTAKLETPKPKTDKERKEEKKKYISALEQVLTEGAFEENDIFDYQKYTVEVVEDSDAAANATVKPKSADQIVQELLVQTGSATIADDLLIEKLLRDSAQGQILVRNMKQMRTLNRRAERMKMTTKNRSYSITKGYEDEDKARAKYPKLGEDISKTTPTGEKRAKNTERSRVVPGKKEAYGPAIDVVNLIKTQSQIRMKNIKA